MKHFFANIAVMFIVFPKLRRKLRAKIMGSVQKNVKCISNLNDDYLHLKAEWLAHNNGIPPRPGRNSEYDLIFCIGATCYGTTILDYFNLRRFSSPFEYTAGAQPDNWEFSPNVFRDTRFRQKIQSLCDNFKDWLNPQDFKYVSKFILPNIPFHHVVNTRTKIRYMHEFPVDQDIFQYMPRFIEKTHRRIQHLYDAINKSNNILIIWVSSVWEQRTYLEKNIPDKDIKWAIKKLNAKYPNKMFDFAFFEPDGSKGRFEYEKIEVAPGAYRIKSNHFLIDPEYNFIYQVQNQDRPHVHVISEMFDNIRLSKNAFTLSETNKN